MVKIQKFRSTGRIPVSRSTRKKLASYHSILIIRKLKRLKKQQLFLDL